MIISIFSMFLPPFSNIGIASKTLMACCHCSAFLQAWINALQLTTSAVTCTAAIDLKSCRACCHSSVRFRGIQLGHSTVSRSGWAPSEFLGGPNLTQWPMCDLVDSQKTAGSCGSSFQKVWSKEIHRQQIFSISPSWGKMTRNCEIWELCWWLDRVGYHCGSSF